MTTTAEIPTPTPVPRVSRQLAVCATCSTPMVGPYCYHCGEAAGDSACRSCGHVSRDGSRYCTTCGGSLTLARSEQPKRARLAPALLGGGLVAALVLAVLSSGRPAPVSPQGLEAPSGGSATPPDISNLSPRERFDRLYQRVITAAQSGDQATVERFTPMAVAAYGMLDSIDPDARYHLSMLELHVGNLSGAEAQADTLRRTAPDHLFGYVIGAAVARWRKDEAGRAAQYRKFLERYDAELASNKREYAEHHAMLVEVKKTAEAAR